uniref:Uncharacterized protein n=1 Tax=Arundo donax TaxID=35708 RepID=A0A0A9A705_ARUDO
MRPIYGSKNLVLVKDNCICLFIHKQKIKYGVHRIPIFFTL